VGDPTQVSPVTRFGFLSWEDVDGVPDEESAAHGGALRLGLASIESRNDYDGETIEPQSVADFNAAKALNLREARSFRVKRPAAI
jgi:hypothetical protein